MPVTPTHVAVVLNGLLDRDDPAAVLVTVRCPHCGDWNVHGLPAPVRVGRDGTFGHRAALCGAAAGYWVVDPNGRVGVILRRHARQAAVERPPRWAAEPGTVGGGRTRLIDRSDPSWTGCSPCRPTLAAGPSSFAVSVELALTAPASSRTATPRG